MKDKTKDAGEQVEGEEDQITDVKAEGAIGSGVEPCAGGRLKTDHGRGAQAPEIVPSDGEKGRSPDANCEHTVLSSIKRGSIKGHDK